jgi:hypothetical protein
MALLSGAIVPVLGVIDHCPIFKPAYSLAPFPPFLTSFFTSLTYFLPAFLGSPPPPTTMLLAASSLACLSFSIFSKSSFLNY